MCFYFKKFSRSKKTVILDDTYTNKEEIETETEIQWKEKYDLSISILKFEYSRSLEEFNIGDEKANKYLLIVSIIMTGFFVVTSTLTTNILNFSYIKNFSSSLLSTLLILFLMATAYFGYVIFDSALKCLALQDIKKMPDMHESLDHTAGHDSMQYREYIVKSYKGSIDSLSDAIKFKHEHLEKISNNIGYFITFLCIDLTYITFLKLSG